MTNRRALLASVGGAISAVIAGCSGEQETEPVSPTNDSEEDLTDPDPEQSNETEEPDPSQTTDLELSVDMAEWYAEGHIAEFILSNDGDKAIRDLEAIVDWYNDQGEYIGWDRARVPALSSGAGWYLHVESSLEEAADTFEMTPRGTPQPREVPDGLEIQSSEAAETAPEVTGVISNTTSSEVGATVVATVYDNDWLTHVGDARETRIPSGEDWRFDVPLRSADADNVPPGEDVELFVSQL